jgi:ABC-type transporter MlaC component
MSQKIRQLEICILSFMLSFASLTRAHAGAPLDLVRTTVDRAIQILKDPELSSPDKKQERVDRLREALAAIFDYEEMAKRALGPPLAAEDPGGTGRVCQTVPRFLGKSLLG